MSDVEKTSAWTDEERAEMAKRRYREGLSAYVLDTKGRPLRFKVAPWDGHICPEYEHCSLCVDEARDTTAAIVGGFIGMGIEIRDRNACRTCGANHMGEGAPCMACVRCP